VELTAWIKANPAEAQKILVNELKEETKGEIEPEAIAHAWQRITFTGEISAPLVAKAVQDAKDAGFSKGPSDTSKLVVQP
jgi:sulfonate transport system substrate-binding protein